MRSAVLCLILFVVCTALGSQAVTDPKLEAQSVALVALLQRTPALARETVSFPIHAEKPGWGMGIVSSVAVDPRDARGTVYILQRGEQADPIVAVDRQGKVLRSWGKGLYNIPHTIRIDAAGNFWTVDAGTSLVIKFSPDGRKLMEIPIGEVPTRPNQPAGSFLGATDLAFGPQGRLYISDGYGNARILVYDAAGKRISQWGTHGKGPGEFETPHGIAFDGKGTIYVADRGNNRIQRFALDGRYLGEWSHVGKPYSLQYSEGALWAGVQRPDQSGVSGPARRPPGWILKIDPATGNLLGQIADQGAHHFIEVTKDGDIFGGSMPAGFLWFRRQSRRQ